MAAVDDLYAELKGWTNRQDITDPVMSVWLRSAEMRFSLELRHRDMITQADLTYAGGSFSLPADYLDRRWLRVKTDPTPNPATVRKNRVLEYVPIEQYWDRDSDPYMNRGPSYSLDGNTIFADDASVGTVLQMSYYKTVPSLTLGANWLWNRYRPLYVFACLAEGVAYLEDDERFQLWAAKATALIQGMNDTSRSAQYGEGALRKPRRSFG